MSPESWAALALNVPAACAVIFVVVVFLKHIREDAERREAAEKKREEAREAAEEKRDEALKAISASCHLFQTDIARRNELMGKKVQESMDRNTEALGENTATLNRAADALDRNARATERLDERLKSP